MNYSSLRQLVAPWLVAALGATSLGVQAVDGVILIDQARVNAAGGFPYRITTPGSYRLAGNLTAPMGKGGVVVSAGGTVVLDLNGFSIASGGSCDPAGLNCTPPVPGAGNPAGVWVHDAGTGAGVFSIINGAVSGFTSFGINVQVAGAVEIRDVKVFNNSASGILISRARDADLVTKNIVYRNGGTGIFGGQLVTHNVVMNNGAVGLALQPTGAYQNNFLLGNVQGPVSGGFSLGLNVCGYQVVC
jgi:Right handed beta helix region